MNHRIKYKPIEVGDRFGRLVVIRFIETRRESGTNQLYWECCCDCGEIKIARDANLKNGNTRSCGCLQRQLAARTDWKVTHGEGSNGKESAEYLAWRGMFRRIDNPQNENQRRRYSGRGITICDGLRSSYELFLRLIGRKSNLSLTLDRVNNNGHYSCGECEQCLEHNWPFNLRWATSKEQSANSIHRNQYTGPAPMEIVV